MGRQAFAGRALIGALAMMTCGAAMAAPPPSLKPPAPASPYVSPADEAILRAFFTALGKRSYGLADDLRQDLTDDAARSVADWGYYRSQADDVTPEAYLAFLSLHPGWPQARDLQAKAERALTSSAAGDRVLSFFEDREPVTGEGELALGRALVAAGRTDEGAAMLRRAWVARDWSASEERTILSADGRWLRAEDHAAKADRQLFAIHATNTKRLLPLLAPGERQKAEARIAFLLNDRNATSLYDALPSEAKRDSGVLHAAARYHRRRDDDWEATRFAGLAPLDGASLRDPGAWFTERRLLARQALKEGRFRDAYVLSAYSGLEDGADFAEAEFMAGWIALRFLREPERAQAHFAYLTTGVSSPISLSRGQYWLGRAVEATGETDAARGHYRAAAGHRFAYYGQLAAERLGEDGVALGFPDPPELTQDDLDAFEARPMVRALRIFEEVGEDWAFDRFARALDDQLETPAELLAYAELMAAERKPHLAVRAGKTARRTGFSVPAVTYPLVPVPDRAAGFVEAPLILGLSRQESEFNPRAYSSARAQGLMQLLDSTARLTARKEGIAYQRELLMDDPAYNMTLGAAHLSHLIERFEGSYVMTLAGYNAGPHRVTTWIEEYGDPRDPSVDIVDWVELIPFSETRNYVQRVLENVQIYRARLGGGPIAGRLTDDLTRGGGRASSIANDVPAPRLVEVAATGARADALNVPGTLPAAMNASFPTLHDAPVPSVKPQEG